ncbi:MAG TPA: hypothetical protein VL993_06705 [Stellaceae bacterium]|nr:hypothetical protein [Stellaceae bacterium]
MMRRLVVLALAAWLVPWAALAEPPASFGPTEPMAEAQGGFMGHMAAAPDHGAAGTRVTITADGLPPGREVDLVWRTVEGSWNVADGHYHGRIYKPIAYRIASLTPDGSGHVSASFAAPDDFGFSHDVVLQQGDRLLTQAAFSIDMQVKVSPAHASLGSPISIDISGIGWRELENSWMLLYDNRFTGWVSAVTTRGSAHVTIPAVGAPGTHVLALVHGEFTFPYLNPQQNPDPDRPRFSATFTLTPGAPTLPPDPPRQALLHIKNLPPPGALVTEPRFAGVGQAMVARATGLVPGRRYQLSWGSITGNRVTDGTWQENSRVVATAVADGGGAISFPFKVPDDLGGAHSLAVVDDAKTLSGKAWVATTALPLDVARGPAGTTFLVHLKGVGWTETANIYAVTYDNGYVGYACGFNSQGDVQIFLKATGAPGWHFIDLYPAIYKGEEARPNNFRIPQLTYAADHPGEDLPHFRFAFEVTDDARGQRASLDPSR